MPKITKRIVDAARPRSDRYILWDTEIKGFGLLVLPTSVKSYFYQYRTPEGRQRRATIGKHGGWTPTQARKKAEEYRQLVRNRGDPLADKRALTEAPTVGDMLDAYLASESFKDKAASTQAIDRGRIERHLRPLLGNRHAHLLTDEDVRRAFAAIRSGKTAADVKTRKRGRARVKGGDGPPAWQSTSCGQSSTGQSVNASSRKTLALASRPAQAARAKSSLRMLPTMRGCLRRSTEWSRRGALGHRWPTPSGS